MKKTYKKPFAEVVDLRIQEKITWGDGADISNTGIYAGAKRFNWFEEEQEPTTVNEEEWDGDEEVTTSVAKSYNVWDDDL